MNWGETSGGREGELGGVDIPLVVAAAHEMKSPLALIRQLALLLEDSTSLTDYEREIVMRVKLTSERSLRITQDLTKAQRLEDGLFHLEPINPMALCEEVAHELQPLFSAKGRRIEVESKKTPLVIANRDLLRRVLINFADNALHITTGDEPIRFQLRAHSRQNRSQILIRDYGPGVPHDVWNRLSGYINQPQRVARRPQSSGLGLYLSRQFAEAMNGEIGVHRHRDGASFFVSLQQSSQMRLL